jgi:hypothetical protein
LEQHVERLAISAKAGIVAWSTAEATELAKLSDGTSIQLFPGVTRAVPHDDGRWVLLETLGEPISHFNQRSWGEVSAEARERELARQKKWLERQPDWVVHEVQPPEIQLWDAEKNLRFKVTAFYGDETEWYPAPGHYVAFRMWGIEGKQLNRNIGLTPMAERLRMIGLDQIPLGIEAIGLGSRGTASPTE